MPNYQSGGTFQISSDYNPTGTWKFDGPILPGTSNAAGVVAAATVVATESAFGPFHQTVLTLTNVAVAISQANVGGGTKIYTFPEGIVAVLAASATVTPTTTSAILTTLNGSKTISTGIGSVITAAQASGTLVTTEQDIVNAFSSTSSATINIAGTAGSGYLSATTMLKYDGHTTAQAIYLNAGIPTAADIDGNATTTWSGTVTILWVYAGDY
jgi:hypothetical protein